MILLPIGLNFSWKKISVELELGECIVENKVFDSVWAAQETDLLISNVSLVFVICT